MVELNIGDLKIKKSKEDVGGFDIYLNKQVKVWFNTEGAMALSKWMQKNFDKKQEKSPHNKLDSYKIPSSCSNCGRSGFFPWNIECMDACPKCKESIGGTIACTFCYIHLNCLNKGKK